MKTVKFKEVVKQWEGIAIVREDGQLKEIPLGVVHTDKKLKETGVKDLFKSLNLVPQNAITIEVKKNEDVVTVYEVELDKLKEISKVVEVGAYEPTEEIAE
jgi:hypothetical protein